MILVMILVVILRKCFCPIKPSQSLSWSWKQVKHSREGSFHELGYISTAYFCTSCWTKDNIVTKPQFLVQMSKFWVLLMPRRSDIPSDYWSQVISNFHFMHVAQISELGDKHKAALTRTPDFWSNWLYYGPGDPPQS